MSSLERLDIFPKTYEDFKERTLGGGLISVACGLLALLLFTAELAQYRAVETVDRLDVDTRAAANSKLSINLDLLLPSLPCDEIVMDVVDDSGSEQLAVTNTLHKLRVDRHGVPIDTPEPVDWSHTLAPAFHQRKLIQLMDDAHAHLAETVGQLDHEQDENPGLSVEARAAGHVVWPPPPTPLGMRPPLPGGFAQGGEVARPRARPRAAGPWPGSVTWCPLVRHLVPPGVTWCHPVSPGVTWCVRHSVLLLLRLTRRRTRRTAPHCIVRYVLLYVVHTMVRYLLQAHEAHREELTTQVRHMVHYSLRAQRTTAILTTPPAASSLPPTATRTTGGAAAGTARAPDRGGGGGGARADLRRSGAPGASRHDLAGARLFD